MAKTKKKRKKNKKDIPSNQSPEEVVTDAEESRDYGGIPERDLKKNLGCG